jgi:hypothetical protein
MDSTPNYLSVPYVAQLIKRNYQDEVASQLKFIISLRNPVNRTISSWIYKSTSKNTPSYTDAINKGIQDGNCISKCYKENIGSYYNHSEGTLQKLDNFQYFLLKQCYKIKGNTQIAHYLLNSHVVKSM